MLHCERNSKVYCRTNSSPLPAHSAFSRALLQEFERQAEEDQVRRENVMQGNPLLRGDAPADFTVKRRWDDDVVFKNCAKAEERNKVRMVEEIRGGVGPCDLGLCVSLTVSPFFCSFLAVESDIRQRHTTLRLPPTVHGQIRPVDGQ